MNSTEAIALLRWYEDAGVDEAMDDAPINRFELVKSAAAEAHPAKQERPSNETAEQYFAEALAPMPYEAMAPTAPKAATVAAIAEARMLAQNCADLAALEQAVRGFDGCSIKRTATNTVFYDGNPKAKLMLIGEAPGFEEDKKGFPFCGPSGLLLDKMLGSVGYDRTQCLITNTVYWRPPGNRQPSTEELTICQPFVEKFISLTDPALLVLVGGTATKAVLGTDQGITRLRGRDFEYKCAANGKSYPVAVIYHPSYLLRQPAQKRLAWQDMLAIKARMNAVG